MHEGDVELGPGNLLVVPKGVEHCPRCEDDVQLLPIEPQLPTPDLPVPDGTTLR